MNRPCINLWDDYADEGEPSEVKTHACVEGKATPGLIQEALQAFVQHFSPWCSQNSPETTAAIVLHEPLKLYPHMANQAEFAQLYQPQWRVEIRGLRHPEREAYVEYAQSHPVVVNGSALAMISES